MRSALLALPALVLSLSGLALAQDQVGDGSGLLPTLRRIDPAGDSLEFYGRPVDIALTKDGRRLWIKDRAHIRIADATDWSLLAEAPLPNGASLTGIEVTENGTAWVTNARNELHHFAYADGEITLAKTHVVKGDGEGVAFPCGLALDGETAYVALSRHNQVVQVNLISGEVERKWDVGIAPYDVKQTELGQLAVSCQGGPRADSTDLTAPSAGTETPVDRRGVAAGGSINLIDLRSSRNQQILVGLQPAEIIPIPNRGMLAVTEANYDGVSLIDLRTAMATERLMVKPDERLPFGSMPNAGAVSPDGRTLYIACAGNNAIAQIDLMGEEPKIAGFIPTGWYPGGVIATNDDLFIANVKGIGSRHLRREKEQGWNSHDHRGTVTKVARPNPITLRAYTERVKANGRIPEIQRNWERKGSSEADPVPVPRKLGDPSVFKHVIYVIKENRTYDQFFGDMEYGDGDPDLCTFPEPITPNHHAIARQFVLLDNYYCNGILSADGHSWATEGNVTPYLERAFGGFSRSYTFGDDPLTYSSTGFIWDHVLAGGLSFRNYGELDYSTPPEGWSVQRLWRAYQDGRPDITFDQNIGITRLRRYSSRDYPGWNMGIPDVLRMERFLEEFETFKQEGVMPNMMIVYLPQDHGAGTTPGYPTMASYMADNDLAIGKLVEAVSDSEFWKDTVIFINEDDPQAGYDHVDGHRSICLVASAYSQDVGLKSNFYNQSSVLHTITRIFGLPPMNQQVASAPLMFDCFKSEPSLKKYASLDPETDRTAMNPPLEGLTGLQRHLAVLSASVPIWRPGLKNAGHLDILNRAIWHSMKGYDVPYPDDLAGAHGTGLKERGLNFDPDADDDDD